MLEIKQKIPLGKLSTFQLGGEAAFGATVTSRSELQEALAYAAARGLRVRVLGGGSNLLVSEAGFDGLIIWYRDKKIEIDPASGRVYAGAGAVTAQVAGMSARFGLTGFEWAAGVPGTIGGAVYGNAGASGGEIKDSVVEVEFFENGRVHVFSGAACEFMYRHSIFKSRRDAIILSATLQLARAENPTAPQKKVLEVLVYRQNTQPKGLASTGCIFKNYEPQSSDEIDALRGRGVREDFLAVRRIPAGWLIEQSGLKGLLVGGARVSEVHGNFVVNEGDARAHDVETLIETVRNGVQAKFGVRLEEEITILK